MRFDIILTTFNRLDYTKRTIASLISSGAAAQAERFIIVDNHSTEEGFKEFLDDMYNYANNVFILRRAKNDGWGTAANDALNMSRAPYVLLSNNDVEYQVAFHERMLKTLEENKDIGLLGAWRHTSHGFSKVERADFREMDDVPAVGWMLSKEAMIRVGLLPEHGPCFTKGGNGEDTAYVQRMKQAGYLVGVPGEDLATHIDGY